MKLGSLLFTGLLVIASLAIMPASDLRAADFSIFSITPQEAPASTSSFAPSPAFSQQQSATSFDPGVRSPAQAAPNNVPDGVRIKTNADIQSAILGDRIIFEPHSRESHQIIIERRVEHKNGDITLTGFIGDSSNRVVMTSGEAGTIASIKTPQGAYKINIESNSEWLLSPSDINNLQTVPFTNDIVVPVFLNTADDTSKKSSKRSSVQSKESTPVSAAAPTGTATIDVLVLYTPEMVASLGGRAGVETRINQLVSNTNQAYIDSEMSIVVNLVHAEEIDADNDSANTDLRDSNGNLVEKGELTNFREGNGVYSGVETLRQSKGADLVVLLRDFILAQNNCGLAYVLGVSPLGESLEDISPSSRTHGYSIVHDGSDQGFYCTDYTFAHEIGHNFGLVHDRNHSLDSSKQQIYGVFDYSFGHDKQDANNHEEGIFGTIMSYDGPELAKFSNPDLQCSNYTCGIEEGLSESADNAKSANNLRDNIAVFYPTATTTVEVSITASDAATEENTVNATFTVSRTGDNAAPLLVHLKPIGGSASSGTDYTAIADTVTIPAGQISQTIVVAPLNDDEIESIETVIIEIDTSTNYGLTAATASAQTEITDNDFPTVSIQATDSDAAEAGQDNGVFTLTRTSTGSIAASLTINLLATTGNATSVSDYSALPSSVEIPQNQTSVTVNVIPVNDDDFEGAESVVLGIGASANYDIDPDLYTAQIDIADNDLPEVNIEATDAIAAEASSDQGEFTLTRTGNITDPLTIDLLINGSAIGDLDYTALLTTIVIPAGEASAAVDVIPLEDILFEGTESVIVEIDTSGGNYTSATSSAQVDIADNDVPTVSITASDATASEEATETGTFTVSRTGITDDPLVVSIIALGGSATSGTDYTPLGSSVTILAGDSSATVNVTPVDDSLVEGTETVIINIVISSSYAIETSSAQIEIIDDDNELATVSIEATDASAAETGSDNGIFTITRTGSTTASLVVDLQINGTATSGLDYTELTNPVTIPIGLSSVAINVIPVEDSDFEGTETVIVDIAGASGYTVSTNQNSAQVNVADNDLPSVSIVATDESAAETASGSASNHGTYTLSRTGHTSADLSVNLTSITGSASSGTDYETLPNPVIIPAGQVSKTVDIVPIDDADIESTETVIVGITATSNYTVSSTQNSAQINIEDNDSLPSISITATVATTEEAGSESGIFTVTRTGGNNAQSLLVNFETIGGTATNGTDYATISNTAIIPVDQSSVTINVVPVFDNDSEADETVILEVAESPTSYTVGVTSAQVTIINSELPLVLIVTTDANASEADSDTGTFSILRTGSTTTSLVVNFKTPVGGTATSGADYTALPDSVTIPSGQASKIITVVPVDDNDLEDDETVVLQIATSERYAIGVTSAQVTISDNDEPSVSIVATDNSAREGLTGGDTGSFKISRTGDTSAELVIDFTSIGGSAVNGTDYISIPDSVTIESGQSEMIFEVTPIDDSILEDTESVIVEITAPNQYTVISNQAQVDIADDEIPPTDNNPNPAAFSNTYIGFAFIR